MDISQKEVIDRLCALCTRVAIRVFKNKVNCDCFCMPVPDFKFNDEVLEYMEDLIYADITKRSLRDSVIKASKT